jgi:hypothetical protein
MAEAEFGTDALETLAGAGCMLVVTPCVRSELGQRYSTDSLELALQCQIGEVIGGKMSLLDNMRKAKGEKVRADARFAELTARADTVFVCFHLEKDNMRFTADRKVNIISDFFVLPVEKSVNRASEESGKKSANRALNQVGISVNRALEESGKKSANRALNQVGISVNRALEESGKKSANTALNQVGISVNRALEESGKKSANRAVDVVGIIVNRALEESGKKSANRALNHVGISVNRALEESGKNQQTEH